MLFKRMGILDINIQTSKNVFGFPVRKVERASTIAEVKLHYLLCRLVWQLEWGFIGILVFHWPF